MKKIIIFTPDSNFLKPRKYRTKRIINTELNSFYNRELDKKRCRTCGTEMPKYN